MATEIFRSDRNFRIWAYVVSLSQLLLRSVKTDDEPTRIDILFRNVKAINIRTNLQGISIREEIDEEKVNQLLHGDMAYGEKLRMFVIRSLNSVGYVIAGMVSFHEDSGEYNDPSPCDIFRPPGVAPNDPGPCDTFRPPRGMTPRWRLRCGMRLDRIRKWFRGRTSE
jgi:hypothetical protein